MTKPTFHLLAIETSLDDTCAAVTDGTRVLSNVVASQVAFHEEFGGTVPDIAKRMHLKWIDQVIQRALTEAKVDLKQDIDGIAVTRGPGLAPSLEVGIATAQRLAEEAYKPLYAVNHVEAHLLASFAKNRNGNNKLPPGELFPALGFVISGGHTELILMRALGDYAVLGETLDDAAGEAYDKVARMLQLGYPGGPILSELAREGEAIYQLPIPMKDRQDLHFSFSGLKTAALHKLKELNHPLTKQFCADFAASFQKVAIESMMRKLRKALTLTQPTVLFLGGGVISNIAIRAATRRVAAEFGVPVVIPYSKKLFTDNAAMIGVTAYLRREHVVASDSSALDRLPNWRVDQQLG